MSGADNGSGVVIVLQQDEFSGRDHGHEQINALPCRVRSAVQAESGVKPAAAPNRSDGTVDLSRDRDLVTRCQEGDHQAFDELYLHYYRRLCRFCSRALKRPDDVEDVVQEAFVRAWKALPNLAGDRLFYPWLSVIAANLCIDVQRRSSRAIPVAEVRQPIADIFSGEVDEALLTEIDGEMVKEAFNKLPMRYRRILDMREVQGWSYRKIAEAEELSPSAVETLIWRARQALIREFSAVTLASGRMCALFGLLFVAFRRIFSSVHAPVRRAFRPVLDILGIVGSGGGVATAGMAMMLLPAGGPLLAMTAPPAATSAAPSQAPTAVGATTSKSAPTAQQSGGSGSSSGYPHAALPSSGGLTGVTSFVPIPSGSTDIPLSTMVSSTLDAGIRVSGVTGTLGSVTASVGGVAGGATSSAAGVANAVVGTVGGVVTGNGSAVVAGTGSPESVIASVPIVLGGATNSTGAATSAVAGSAAAATSAVVGLVGGLLSN